jgi:hypothetical protein
MFFKDDRRETDTIAWIIVVTNTMTLCVALLSLALEVGAGLKSSKLW